MPYCLSLNTLRRSLLQSLPLSFAPRAHVHAHEGAAAIKPSQRGAQIERERTRRRVNATPEDGEGEEEGANCTNSRGHKRGAVFN